MSSRHHQSNTKEDGADHESLNTLTRNEHERALKPTSTSCINMADHRSRSHSKR
jgi:hypothetical protein